MAKLQLEHHRAARKRPITQPYQLAAMTAHSSSQQPKAAQSSLPLADLTFEMTISKLCTSLGSTSTARMYSGSAKSRRQFLSRSGSTSTETPKSSLMRWRSSGASAMYSLRKNEEKSQR